MDWISGPFYAGDFGAVWLPLAASSVLGYLIADEAVKWNSSGSPDSIPVRRFASEIFTGKEENRRNPGGFQGFMTKSG